MFDGCDGGGAYYVGVFATYPANNCHSYEKILIGMSPIENEDCFNAGEHYDYMEYALDVHGKNYINVAAIIGDKTSTDKAFARRAGPIFVGCHSHKFNLAVKDILCDYTDVV